MLASLNIAKKTLLVTLATLPLPIAAAVYAIVSMSAIGHELDQIAHEDMPLTEMVTEVTILQLEQAVQFERSLNHGNQMKNDANEKQLYTAAKQSFSELATRADTVFKKAEALMKDVQAKEHTPAVTKQLKQFNDQIHLADKHHHEYEILVAEIFREFDAGNYVKAKSLSKNATDLETELDHELENILRRIEKFTEKALLTAEAHEKSAFDVLVIMTLLGAVGGIATGYFMGKSISGPVGDITRALERLSGGDTSVRAPDVGDRRDEVAVLWRVVEEFRLSLGEAFRLQNMIKQMPFNVMTCNKETREIDYMNDTCKKRLKKLERHLSIRAEDVMGQSIDIFQKDAKQKNFLRDEKSLPYKSRFKLGDDWLEFEAVAVTSKDGEYLGPMVTWDIVTEEVHMAQTVQNVVSIVTQSADTMKEEATQVNQASSSALNETCSMMGAINEASNNVQLVAASAEELTATVQEISKQVSISAQVANDAVEKANRSNDKVGELSEASRKIGEVVQLITDIADQTNLLALNATIEAARAGDAGKGFAVVAGEVKNLATQTAHATDEITSQIKAIQETVAEAADTISTVSGTIGQMDEISAAIAAAIEEQNAATHEIARSAQAAAEQTTDATTMASNVQSANEQTGTSASSVLNSSDGLADQASNLENTVTKYLDRAS